jgi:outer membrane immunogenic protein
MNRGAMGVGMKRLLLAGTAVFIGGSAMAAPPPPQPFTWTGCYIGAHAGAGWSQTKLSNPGATIIDVLPAGGEVGIGSDVGFIGGGQLGCDYQFAQNWVIGLAGDFSFASIDGRVDDPFFVGKNGNPAPLRAHTDELASLTGRVGYTWDRYLIYGKGGVAWAHNKYNLDNLFSFNGPFCGSGPFVACNAAASDTHAGWTAGAGFEWAFSGNWSVLLEYDHYGFGSKTLTFVDQEGHAAPIGIKQDIDVVKVGFNFRFGGLLGP